MIINVGPGSPIFFQLVIDKVLVHKGFSTLQTLAVGMIVHSRVRRLLQLHQADNAALRTNKIDMRRPAHFNHLLYLPTDFFESSSAGVLLKQCSRPRRSAPS
jgi:ABC-type bacteriocin/lantibiotic exporter with double-glycine peptidase domain